MLAVVLGKLCVSIFFPSQMLAAQVLVCKLVGLKCWELLRMLAAQVLVCQSVGLKCWKFCGCWMQRYLCACLSVGLKCWKFCWESCDNTLHVSTIFPSERLSAQVLVYLPISWVERLEVPCSIQKCWLHRNFCVYRLV